MTYKLSELGFVNITNDDLDGAFIEFRQKVKTVDQADDKKPLTKYRMVFKIRNCKRRNVAQEALDLFKEICQGHLDHMKQKFSGGFFRTIGTLVQNIRDNGLAL